MRCAIALAVLAAPVPAQLDADAYRQDLEFVLQEWLPNNAALDDAGKASVKQLLMAGIEDVEQLDDGAFGALILRVAAVSQNGHDLAGFGLLGAMPRLPMRVWWFADGLFVVKAHPDHEDLLGARIVAIGDLEASELEEGMAPYLPGNAAWRRHRGIEFVTRLPLLAALGAARRTDRIPVMFRLPDGSTLRRTLRAPSEPDPEDDTLQPWRESLQRGRARPTGSWPHVLDRVAARPAYLRSDAPVWYEEPGADLFGYVRITGFRNPDGPGSMIAELQTVLHQVAETSPANVVVDLRFNTGGNFFHAVPFAVGLGALLPSDGRLYVLCNRATFSAAIVTMGLLVTHVGADRCVVVGEPIGDDLRFYAEGGNLTLPRSRILLCYNDGLHDLRDGGQPGEGVWWGARAFERGVGDLDPDIAIEQSFTDYRAGRDLYLEAVRRAIAKR